MVAPVPRWLASPFAFLLFLTVSFVWVASAQQPVTVGYQAGEGCPDAEQFLARLRARTPHARLPSTGEQAQVQVEVGRTDQGAEGTLRRAGQAAVRTVLGANCDDVASALALVAALMIEEQREAREAPAAAASPCACEPCPPAGSARVQTSPAPVAPVHEEKAPAPPWRVAGSFVAVQGVAPAWMPASEHAIERLTGRWGGMAGLSFLRGSVDSTGAEGAGQTRLYVGRVMACPASLGLVGRLSLLPCAGLGGGVIVAQGQAQRPVSATRGWADGVLVARLNFQASRHVAVMAHGGVLFPFTRYNFKYVNPAREFHAVSPVSGVAGIGIIFGFP
jgi:hypothetical protein